MRLALVSLMALAASANAFAQTAAAPPPAAAAPAPPAATMSPPDAATAPAPAPTTPAPATGDTASAAPAAPPAPPPPPPDPTDPTAIAVLDVLKNVCIPAANGGDLAQLAKADGMRKNNDLTFSKKQKDFTLTIQNPGSNPNQCHVVVTHPADLESPGRPIIVALNDWAGVKNGWSLYRNDKNVQEGVQFTTRSWQLDWNGTEQSLVFTTKRKPDGTPLHQNTDESELIYGVMKTG
jgi:hypothetical protein